MKAVKAHETNCKITSYVLNGGFYNAQEIYLLLFLKNIKNHSKIPRRKTIKSII
jgi:hypothetical protein